MNIVRKDLDALNATLTFNIVKSDYEEKVNKAIKDYSKKVNMPGFRPGKVPAGLIKKQFGTQLLVDEINKMVSEELYKYIKDNNINILGEREPEGRELRYRRGVRVLIRPRSCS